VVIRKIAEIIGVQEEAAKRYKTYFQQRNLVPSKPLIILAYLLIMKVEGRRAEWLMKIIKSFKKNKKT
jgi:hypothetical protein